MDLFFGFYGRYINNNNKNNNNNNNNKNNNNNNNQKRGIFISRCIQV